MVPAPQGIRLPAACAQDLPGTLSRVEAATLACASSVRAGIFSNAQPISLAPPVGPCSDAAHAPAASAIGHVRVATIDQAWRQNGTCATLSVFNNMSSPYASWRMHGKPGRSAPGLDGVRERLQLEPTQVQRLHA